MKILNHGNLQFWHLLNQVLTLHYNLIICLPEFIWFKKFSKAPTADEACEKDLWLECRCGHIFIPRMMTFLSRDETCGKNIFAATAENLQVLFPRHFFTETYIFCLPYIMRSCEILLLMYTWLHKIKWSFT